MRVTLPAIPARWPLVVIGAAAGTSTWSGWVGLGQLTGFGVVKPLPGIADGVSLNTAITLPIGVEAYAVYALAVATGTAQITGRARRYAWASSGAALGLGMLGQIAYHVMAAAKVAAAPWQVVALVSCLPVLVLGAASLLWHLATEEPQPVQVIDVAAEPVAATEPAADLPLAVVEPIDVAPETEPSPARPIPDLPAAKPAVVPDGELARIVREAVTGHADGWGKVKAAIEAAGYSVGNTGRVKAAIAQRKADLPDEPRRGLTAVGGRR